MLRLRTMACEKLRVVNSGSGVMLNVNVTALALVFFIVEMWVIERGWAGWVFVQVTLSLHSRQPGIRDAHDVQIDPFIV